MLNRRKVLTMGAFVARRPITFALLVMVLLEAVVLLSLLLSRMLGVAVSALDLPIMLLNAIIAAVLLHMLGWWRAAGFNAPSRWRNLHLLVLPVLLLVGPSVAVGLEIPAAGKVAALAVVTLLIGFQEEAIFRGVLLRALAPKGIMRAVLISALLFGVIHANSLLVGRDPIFVLAQIVSSTLGAIGLGALRVRLQTIWPLVILHAVNDLIQFTATGGIEAAEVALYIPILKILLASAMAVYGFYLLRGAPEGHGQPVLRGEPTSA